MSSSIPKQHKAAVIKNAKGKMETVTKDTPQPQNGEVLIKVTASGICASDHFTVQGMMGSPYPLSAGHEVVGRLAALGPGVDETQFKVGSRVGLGWNGGYCSQCEPCREGDFIHCEKSRITGVTIDGGHQQYIAAHASAVVHLPQDSNMKDSEVAPLLCAGNTVYEAMLYGNMRAGDVVLVQGLGGLGHLAIQIARKAGCQVVAVSGSPDKKELAQQLGAHHYFSAKDDLAGNMKKLGLKAKVAVATAPSGDAPKALIPVLDRYGTLVIVGTPNDGKPLDIDTFALISKCCNVRGAACGPAASNDRFTAWCNLFDIKAMVQEWPLEKAHEAFEDTMNGKPKFRNVIVME